MTDKIKNCPICDSTDLHYWKDGNGACNKCGTIIHKPKTIKRKSKTVVNPKTLHKDQEPDSD